MSSPAAPLHRPHRRSPFLLTLAVVGSLLLGGGLTAFDPQTAPAVAEDTESALSVKWLGDAGSAASYQPPRDEASVHYGDFQNVSVTVSQTQHLTDQRVRVTVTGMPGATGKQGNGGSQRTATNYVQAMQCWGDPAAEDFVKTCQWGGHFVNGASVVNDMMAANHFRSWRAKLPFRTVWGEEFDESPNPPGVNGRAYNRLFTGDNSNEMLAARMNAAGSGSFDFETQTSNAAPHLGCGLDPAANGAGERCWLVIVPRGSHQSQTGGTHNYCNLEFAKDTTSQVGSPTDPNCDYWGNRMLVPLDFQPTGGTCAVGSAERPVAGADLITTAVSSWQPALCAEGATYSYAALSDSVARDQLLSGQSRFAITGRPVTESTVSEDLAESVSGAEFVYAPIAITAPTIGFIAKTSEDGRLELPLNLTPRLVAKLLTQSYLNSIPFVTGFGGIKDFPEYTQANNALGGSTILYDPDFIAINPEWEAYRSDLTNSTEPGLIVVPTSSDVNAQLWRWMQADEKARSFLNGEPDNVLPGDEQNAGLKINPNYLPKGHANATVASYVEIEQPGHAGIKRVLVIRPELPRIPTGLAHDDGTPYSLADTLIDTLPRADPWEAPRTLSQARNRFDTTQFNQARGTLKDVATDVARDTRKSLSQWDGTVMNAAGEFGAWVPLSTAGYTGHSMMMGLTSMSGAELNMLNTARLQLPNQPGVYSAADTPGLLTALGGATETEVEGVTTVDPAKVGAGAYPLTQIVWGAMRLDGSSPEERADYAAFIEQVTTEGQIPGTSAGQLPVGYAPLTDELKAQAAVAAKKIRDYVAPGDPASTPTAPANTTTTPAAPNAPPAPSNTTPNPGGPNVSAGTGPGETGETETNAPEGLAAVLSAVGGTLLLGASGAIAVPGILRRRDSTLI